MVMVEGAWRWPVAALGGSRCLLDIFRRQNLLTVYGRRGWRTSLGLLDWMMRGSGEGRGLVRNSGILLQKLPT